MSILKQPLEIGLSVLLKGVDMTESITITLPKKMPLAQRISEAASQIKKWLQVLEVAFNSERDKLHLRKSDLRNNEYRYRYAVVRGKASSAGKMNIKKLESDSEIHEVLAVQ